MGRRIAESELILRKDGSIYHLGLLPEDVAETVIFVGDQHRVPKVSKYFDSIEIKKEVREFVTHTGILNGKRISVISTGIGCDNIDIVMNELDALVNIDFKTRTEKDIKTSLTIVRIGTSGSLQPDIPVDSFLISTYGLGIDGLLNYYEFEEDENEKQILNAISNHTNWNENTPNLYLGKANESLNDLFKGDNSFFGITVTANGFYAPQGRSLRLNSKNVEANKKFETFFYENHRITNLEMETSAILSLGKLLGHKCASTSALLANRANQTFSINPSETVDKLIQFVLEKLTA